jgi:hypothetical protein
MDILLGTFKVFLVETYSLILVMFCFGEMFFGSFVIRMDILLLGTFKVFLVETYSLILVVFCFGEMFFWFFCHQIGYTTTGYIQKCFLWKLFSLVLVIHFVYAINE